MLIDSRILTSWSNNSLNPHPPISSTSLQECPPILCEIMTLNSISVYLIAVTYPFLPAPAKNTDFWFNNALKPPRARVGTWASARCWGYWKRIQFLMCSSTWRGTLEAEEGMRSHQAQRLAGSGTHRCSSKKVSTDSMWSSSSLVCRVLHVQTPSSLLPRSPPPSRFPATPLSLSCSQPQACLTRGTASVTQHGA